MTTKKKSKNNALRGRVLSAALSLGLLAAAGMVGMYTVGKTEQRKEEEELARKQAEARKADEEALRLAALEKQQEEARLEEIRRAEEKKLESQTEEASSGGATAAFDSKLQKEPELESDFAMSEKSSTITAEEALAAMDEAAKAAELADAAALEASLMEAAVMYTFSPETDHLLWPIAGNIIMDYSMDKTVYFATLDQYKYNPAILIQGKEGREVVCGADGKVDRVVKHDELGNVVYVDFGDGYEGVYGQLKDIAVEEGSMVQPGVKLGVISEPTHYYAKEGAHVYFQILKEGKPVDPMDLLQ